MLFFFSLFIFFGCSFPFYFSSFYLVSSRFVALSFPSSFFLFLPSSLSLPFSFVSLSHCLSFSTRLLLKVCEVHRTSGGKFSSASAGTAAGFEAQGHVTFSTPEWVAHRVKIKRIMFAGTSTSFPSSYCKSWYCQFSGEHSTWTVLGHRAQVPAGLVLYLLY